MFDFLQLFYRFVVLLGWYMTLKYKLKANKQAFLIFLGGIFYSMKMPIEKF
jgi:hypothetical protein